MDGTKAWAVIGEFGLTSSGSTAHKISEEQQFDEQGRQVRAARSVCNRLLVEPARLNHKRCQQCARARDSR